MKPWRSGSGPLWTAKCLGVAIALEIAGVGALDSLDEPRRQRAGEIGILAQRLLPAAPARIAEDVDVGRPEGEAEVAVEIMLALRLIVTRAALHRDRAALGEEQVAVPARGHRDRLGEDGRLARARDAVERLVPIVVGRDAEPRDRRRDILHLRGLFLKRHPADEIVDARRDRRLGIAVELGMGGKRGEQRAGQHDRERGETPGGMKAA